MWWTGEGGGVWPCVLDCVQDPVYESVYGVALVSRID